MIYAAGSVLPFLPIMLSSFTDDLTVMTWSWGLLALIVSASFLWRRTRRK
jgi:hypothetical protein